MNPNAVPLGNVARAIWETTETLVLGLAPVCTASQDTPTKNVTATTPRIASVRAALRAWGCRNALTPLEIASIPVSAAEPDAKARSRTKKVTALAPAGIASGVVATGQVVAAHLPMPRPIITR